jgi:purine-nucleoside phosphorylase
MSAPFAEFSRTALALGPRTAVVLGSGLGGAAAAFRESASVAFGDVPGLVPATVRGHAGRLAVGSWGGTPVLLCLGRLHFYEGHPREVVTGTVRTFADLGVRRVVLTNAAGGIHPSLGPGSLMAIRGHIPLLGPDAWRAVAAGNGVRVPYSPALLRLTPEVFSGVYAALTGPCYETPAEIRALAACGADAVGMSTALEAEAAADLSLEVAGVSCVTNRAAGLGASVLDHAEVLANAKLAVERLGELLGSLVRAG